MGHSQNSVSSGDRQWAQAEHERLLLIERTGRQLAEALGRVALAMNATIDLPELLNRHD